MKLKSRILYVCTFSCVYEFNFPVAFFYPPFNTFTYPPPSLFLLLPYSNRERNESGSPPKPDFKIIPIDIDCRGKIFSDFCWEKQVYVLLLLLLPAFPPFPWIPSLLSSHSNFSRFVCSRFTRPDIKNRHKKNIKPQRQKKNM